METDWKIELRNAVLLLDVPKVESLLASYPDETDLTVPNWDGDCMSDFPQLPIEYIPQYWNCILCNPSRFEEQHRQVLESSKIPNQKIESLLKERLAHNYRKINLYDQRYCYMRWTPNCTVKSVLGYSRKSLISDGFRNIDIDLRIAFARFDFNKVEELLHHGAFPGEIFGEFENSCEYITDVYPQMMEKAVSDFIFAENRSKYLFPPFDAFIEVAANFKMQGIIHKYFTPELKKAETFMIHRRTFYRPLEEKDASKIAKYLGIDILREDRINWDFSVVSEVAATGELDDILIFRDRSISEFCGGIEKIKDSKVRAKEEERGSIELSAYRNKHSLPLFSHSTDILSKIYNCGMGPVVWMNSTVEDRSTNLLRLKQDVNDEILVGL